MGEVEKESEGFVFLLFEVQFGLSRGGIEMFKSSKSPGSSFAIEMTATPL